MFSNSPHDDQELTALARRLNGVAWPPAPEQRDRILYACGQAAGRAQMKRRVRVAFVIATLSLCAAAGLTFDRLHRDSHSPAVVEQGPSPTFKTVPPPEPHEALPSERFSLNDREGQLLRVASNFQQLASSGHVPNRGRFAAGASPAAAERILTAADRSISGDL